MGANKGLSTINTVLKLGGSRADAEKLCNITGYPDLMGTPEMIEVTDMEDTQEKFAVGVQSQDLMEFSANYTPEGFKNLYDTQREEHRYHRLEMGIDGEDGIFVWQGAHTVRVNGSGVNEARTMTISCVVESEIRTETDSGSLGDETGKQLVTNKGNPIGFIELQ